MFDDFQPSSTSSHSRARFRNSIAAAIVLYGGSSAAIVAATATVQKVLEEEMTQVEFAKAPEPEPEPPPPPEQAPPPTKSLRPKVKRPDLVTPVKISDEKLKESDKALAAAGEGGPLDGSLDGVEGGTGTGRAPPPPPPPPPPKASPLVAPVAIGSQEHPKYSSSARRKGIEGVVVVTFVVTEDGRVSNPRIVSGPPELHETVLRAVVSWRFRPAHRGDKAVRYPMTTPVRFRLEDA